MRKGELLFNYAVMLGPMVVGLGIAWAMSLTYSMPRATFWAVIVFYFVGFALFAKSKYSVITQGHPERVSNISICPAGETFL